MTDQPTAINAATGAPVCGSAFAGVRGGTVACTWPPGHGPIVGTDGQPWEHGIHGTPAVWRSTGTPPPTPARQIQRITIDTPADPDTTDSTDDNWDDEDYPRG